MSKRIDELDYLKCIFILLMITFHLVYIGDKYPYAKQVVYTFHIPAFFVISGYVMRVEKPVKDFIKSMFWIVVPYLVMESGYILMSSVLPVREHIEGLTLNVFLDKLFLHPIGPYWYLHTLVICGIVYYVSFIKFSRGGNVLTRLLFSFLLLSIMSLYYNVLSLSSVLYFLAGVSISRSSVSFTSFFRASWLSIPVFCVMILFRSNLDRFSIGGIFITFLAVSALLFLYKLLPGFIHSFLGYIGRHTMVLLLFSPIFTILVKPLVPLLAFESSGMLFLFLSLLINVCGCFLITFLMDRLHISPFFLGRKNVMEPLFRK